VAGPQCGLIQKIGGQKVNIGGGAVDEGDRSVWKMREQVLIRVQAVK
jgi:hypothetical protein